MKKKKIDELLALDMDYFDDWVRHLPYNVFDLNASKEEMFTQFYNKLMAGEFKNCDDLSKMVMKSYYTQRPQEAQPFINASTININKPHKLLMDFYNRYLADNPLEDVESQEVLSTFATFFTQKLQEIFGRVVYLDFKKSLDGSMFKSKTKSLLKAMGYSNGLYTPKFFRMNGHKNEETWQNPQTATRYQNFIVQQYQNIVNTYIQNYLKFVINGMEGSEFDQLWGCVQAFCQNCEQMFLPQTQQDKQIIEAEAKVHDFFENRLEVLRAKYTKDGQNGRYAAKVNAALEKFAKGTATEKDRQTLAEFENRMYILQSALSVTDKNGNFPLNAFVIFPMPVQTAKELMQKFIKSGFCDSEKTQRLYHIRSMLSHLFTDEFREQYLIIENPDFMLTKFKIKCRYFDKNTKKYKETDFSTEENFAKLKKQVKQTMEQYSLPRFVACYNLIAYNVIRGRAPIKLTDQQLEELQLQPAKPPKKNVSGKGKET